MAAAQTRENCTIPGTSVRTAWLCRDKPSMKDALRAAGIPTAASAAVTSAAEVHEFVAAIGFPIILKPRTGAGALDTVQGRRRAAELDEALGRFGGQGVESIAVEEFVEGHEGFYDTVSVNGSGRAGLRLALLPQRAGGDAHPVDLPAVRLHQPGRLGAGLPGAARDGRPGERGPGHRHQRHPHGVVLRAEGAAVLRDRLPAARRRAPGTCTRPATTSTSTGSGPTRSCTTTSRCARRASSPPGSSRCGRTGTGTSAATPGSTRPRAGSASG